MTRAAPSASGVTGTATRSEVRPRGGGLWSLLEFQVLVGRRFVRSIVLVETFGPLLYMLSLGLGLGQLVNRGGSGLGVDYKSYLAPALIAATALQLSSTQATYPIMAGFKWVRYFFAMNATPLTARQIADSTVLWLAFRAAFASTLYLIVAALFGAVHTPLALLCIPLATLGAMAFTAPVVAYSASQEQESNGFNVIYRFMVTPMFLFSGTFYPIASLPTWAQLLAKISPLWHATELCRWVALGPLHTTDGLGRISALAAFGHLAYLSALVAIGYGLSVWRFRLRLSK